MRIHLSSELFTEESSELLLKTGAGEYLNFKGKVTIPAGVGTVVMTLAGLMAPISPDVATPMKKSMDWLCKPPILNPKNDKAALNN